MFLRQWFDLFKFVSFSGFNNKLSKMVGKDKFINTYILFDIKCQKFLIYSSKQ